MENAAGGSGNTSLRTLMFNDKIDTPNLGDFLRVKQDDNTNNDNNLAGLTLGAMLSNKRECSSSSTVHSNRTLLDIIRDDPNSIKKTRKTWKHIRDKLRLKPPAEAWMSNIPINQGNDLIISRRLSHDVVATYPVVENFGQPEISASGSRSRMLGRDLRMSVENETVEEEESEGENTREEIGVEMEDQPVRMSLMALLTENDGDGSAYMMGDGDEEEEEEDGEDDIVVVGVGACEEYNNCCVCMVRHKAAAFIPCGHTFCRLCSRELWVQRGNCPLCNNFIFEVLDIF